MEQIKEYLQAAAAASGITITKEQEGRFQTYCELLAEWNQKMNLTAITDVQGVAMKHFLDSILLLNYLDFKEGDSLIDIGTGAGFPGLPLKIMRQDIRLTLLDSLNKRLIFLKEALFQLSLEADCIHARAEEGGRQRNLRGKFEFATARAVAPLNVLAEYCLPYLKMGGTFAAMKGPEIQEELEAAERAVSLLGCEVQDLVEYRLPNGDGRSLVLIRRTGTLPAQYPRQSAKISKSPL